MTLEHAEPLNVWLFARDLERARRFYADALGLPLWREEPGEALHFGVGGALLSVRRAEGASVPPHGSWLAFTVTSGIDTVCDELRDRGVTFEAPLADRPFGRSAMFRDPDGHELWICQPSATETQFFRWEQARRIRPRPAVARPKPKVRRHERAPPSRRRVHPLQR